MKKLLLGAGIIASVAIGELLADQFVRIRAVPVDAQGGSLNAGDIVIRVSGNCGSGFTEVASLDGKVIRGTVAANMDQAGTGGSDTVTPEGTLSAHSGSAVANHASHTHDYTQVVNHTHTVDVGAAVDTNTASGAGNVFAGTTNSVTATTANPSGGVATGTTAGPSATLTHSVTQPDNHTFTGTQHSTLPAYTKVIFCEKS